MIRFLFLIFTLSPLFVMAQRPGASPGSQKGITGTIHGIISDSLTNLPIEYAAVGVLNSASGKIINGGITDIKGHFRISSLPLGVYTLQLTFIGYTSKEVIDIRLTPQRPDADAGTILLIPQSQLLEEVKVVGEAPLIEAKPDKIVYNAERDITSKGGDAADVLRKVPLLTVDFDGNVSMRGSENIRILINGRPSGMFNANVADALKMMPADQIKSVEVITSPSAKYDGEGTAGIINIITKKKNIEGLAGNVDLTGGTRSNRANMNLNYGRGRLGLNVSGGGHHSWPQEGSTVFRREEFGIAQPSLLTQDGTTTSDRLSFRTTAAAEYNINAFSSFNSSFSYRIFRSESDINVLSRYTVDQNLVDDYQRTVDGISNRGGWDWELDYKKTFPKKENEWSMALEIDKDDTRSESDYNQWYSFPPEALLTVENNLNLGDNLEITVQTDYVHPFSKRVKMETGAKATLRNIDSDFKFSSFDPDQNAWFVDDMRTDVFLYDQNVYAGYISSTVTVGAKTNVIGGVRLEITDLEGAFKRFESPFANQYTNVLPSLTISRKVGDFNQVKISYSQRIQRPNQRHINPYIEYNDNRDISFGNPTLTPELVHQVEIGSNFFIKSNMINVSVFGRRTEDLIENLLRINDEGVSETTYENFGFKSSLGLNVFGSLNIGERLSLRGGFDVSAWEVKGVYEGEDLANSGYDYNGRMNITWSINETLAMEGFSFFRSPSYTVQGKIPNWTMISFGIKKELFQKRLTIGFNIFQPFREDRVDLRELSGSDFFQSSRNVRPVRSFGLNLGYRFGKLDFRERSGRKKVNNNDLKEEEQGGDSPFQG